MTQGRSIGHSKSDGQEGSVMSSLTTFDSTKEGLLDMLQGFRSGKTQLPDFQRGWVWDDEHVCSLLASISLSYPIGAVRMLQSGNAPSAYLAKLQRSNTILPARMEAILQSHVITPATLRA